MIPPVTRRPVIRRHRIALLALACATLVAMATAPRPAQAVSDSLLALAGPLAEQFGVPANAVTGLLKDGLSLDTVTQLLLIKDGSKKSLDEVTSLYDKSKDVSKTAEQLGVSPSAYSKDRVTAAIDQAKQKAAADATDRAQDEAGNALNKALGGLR